MNSKIPHGKDFETKQCLTPVLTLRWTPLAQRRPCSTVHHPYATGIMADNGNTISIPGSLLGPLLSSVAAAITAVLAQRLWPDDVGDDEESLWTR
jgi:hypothetical protein